MHGYLDFGNCDPCDLQFIYANCVTKFYNICSFMANINQTLKVVNSPVKKGMQNEHVESKHFFRDFPLIHKLATEKPFGSHIYI